MTELLGRLGVVVGISLVLTMLLIVLYQDDGMEMQPEPASITQASATPTAGTP